jgi:molybdopterin-guanine dinucleotide biosynthesis protein A
MMKKDITGCILAGGKSSRYGTDKALIRIGEQTIIEKLASELASVFTHMMIISNAADTFAFLNYPVHPDIIRNIGPLGGIHSALSNSKTDKVFLISCDLPYMTADFIRFITEQPAERPIVLPVTNGIIQPLCGIYSKACLPVIMDMIGEEGAHASKDEPKKWKYSPLVLIEKMKAGLIDVVHSYPMYDEKIFYNINHPEDYENIVK